MADYSDSDSCEVDYDPDIDGAVESDEEPCEYSERDSDSEDSDGPDLSEPVDTELLEPRTNQISLPLRPNPTPEGWTPPIITSQALDIASSGAYSLKPKKKEHTVGARIAAISLLDCGFDREKIVSRTGIALSTIYGLRKKAEERGWVSGMNIETWHVDDAKRSGRPTISPLIKSKIIEVVRKNSTTRGWSCARIAQEVSLSFPNDKPSASSVYRHLRAEGYIVCKRTIKPGLNKAQKDARLAWCELHKTWTLEDWKNVIFTDETSVQMGGVRGKRRVWRLSKEAYHPHVISRRWKGFSEFMWWSCFSYDQKGPYHIWEAETKEEKAAQKKDIDLRNSARFMSDKAVWEDEWDLEL